MKRRDNRLLPFDVIQKATSGDEEALRTVLANYDGYIRTLAIRMSVGADGGKHYAVDEEIRGRLQGKLMKAVMHVAPLSA